MAITYTSGVTNSAASGSAPTTGVHGITINSGDFVAVYINSNSTTSITHGGSEGTAFTSQIDETPSGKTCRQALFTKTAGASEPTSYTFASGDAQWQCIIKVFSSDDALTVDAAANSHIQGGNETLLACGAVNGETISDNALSIVAGGKDNRSTGNT